MNATSSAAGPLLKAAGLGLVLALGACGNVHDIEVGSVPLDYRARHPIVVAQAESVLDIPVLPGEARIAPPDGGRIEDFAGRFKQSGADTMLILVPYGSRNASAAIKVAHAAYAVLRRAGLSRERIVLQSYAAQGAVGATPVRFVYSGLAAGTAPCGRWPEDLGDTSENRNYFNFGCASQQNLAAQIADPRDLLSPRGMGSVDGERRDRVLGGYREGKTFTSAKPSMESNYSW